jgi:hypothetical protein
MQNTPCSPVTQGGLYDHIVRIEKDLGSIRQNIFYNPSN